MNWYKRQHDQLIEGLTFEEILRRIDSAKKRIQSIEGQEKILINYINKEKSVFRKRMWNNRLLALQKSFNVTIKTLNKYIQMIENTDKVQQEVSI